MVGGCGGVGRRGELGLPCNKVAWNFKIPVFPNCLVLKTTTDSRWLNRDNFSTKVRLGFQSSKPGFG